MSEVRNERVTVDPDEWVARPGDVVHTRGASRWMRALLILVGVLLAFVVASPIALSSQDLVDWASSDLGLGLSRGWSLLVFVALDAAAATCVGMVVYSAWRGETAGMFGLLVWLFAFGSAVANYRHGRITLARDDQWFFPAMSLAGPGLLEVTVRRIRRWVQVTAGRYERPLPHFRLVRWLPGLAFRETLTAWKLAVTEGYSRPEDAVAAARSLTRDDVANGSRPPDQSTPNVPSTHSEVSRAADDTPSTTPAVEASRRRHPAGQGWASVVHMPPRQSTTPTTPPVSNGGRPVARTNAQLVADLRAGMSINDAALRHGYSTKTVSRVHNTLADDGDEVES